MRETSSTKIDMNSTRVLLYVIKMQGGKIIRTPTVNMYAIKNTVNKHDTGIEYFKMYLDCSKCQEDGQNDIDLRRFRRKVKKKLRLGDNFNIYNQ
jgi:hypothetical protein